MKHVILPLALIGAMLAADLRAEILGARLAHPPPLVAAPAPSRQAARPRWPAPPSAPTVAIVPRLDDDRPGQWHQIRFANQWLNLELDPLSAWTRLPRPQRYALEWVGRWTPEVHLGISEVPRSTLANLDAPNWRIYLESLRRLVGPQARVTLDDDSNENFDMTRILGGRTRVVRFEIPADEPAQKPSTLIHVVVELPTAILLFACEGPAPDVAGIAPAFENLIARSERVARS